jgi:Uma2 family endonuclease
MKIGKNETMPASKIKMPTASVPFPSRFDRPPVLVRRFSVDEYHQMGQSGLLTPEDRVELLEGWIAPKMNQNPAHGMAIEIGDAVIRSVLPSGWRLRAQLPITMADSEPEPDFAVVRQARVRRSQTHPVPSEIAIVEEVSDSSLSSDRLFKGRIYARASIPVYWIVNLIDRCVEVYSEPTGPIPEPIYKSKQVYGNRKSVPVILDGIQVAVLSVKELLP